MKTHLFGIHTPDCHIFHTWPGTYPCVIANPVNTFDLWLTKTISKSSVRE